MAGEPIGRNRGYLLERAGFLEQMGRAGKNDEFLLRTVKFVERLLVQRDHRFINSPDDQQRWRLQGAEGIDGEIRPASRDTMAAIVRGSCAAAIRAAAAPVLAPK